ncbi:MAG: thiamine phosphate synthase [Caldisericia bacterium]|nr:thiamine phosphate synthase [Caldisericia bacterium]
MKKQFDLTLYAVTDKCLIGRKPFLEAVEEAIAGGSTMIQLREKNLSTKDFLQTANQVHQLCQKFNLPLIINDRADIALACKADGLHIGQDDLPLKIAREILGADKIIGVSVSTPAQALNAEKDGADYVGVGTIFSTGTKIDAQKVDFKTLEEIRNIITIPVVAIGGINERNALQLVKSRIHGIAVVSAIFGYEDIVNHTKLMKQLAKEVTAWKTV